MMDRFEAVDNANADKRSIYDEGRYRAPDWVADKLNTLERELAAANAKIEKALEHHAARTPHHVALERIEAALRKSGA